VLEERGRPNRWPRFVFIEDDPKAIAHREAARICYILNGSFKRYRRLALVGYGFLKEKPGAR
jgi:hypothetical protein